MINWVQNQRIKFAENFRHFGNQNKKEKKIWNFREQQKKKRTKNVLHLKLDAGCFRFGLEINCEHATEWLTSAVICGAHKKMMWAHCFRCVVFSSKCAYDNDDDDDDVDTTHPHIKIVNCDVRSAWWSEKIQHILFV